MPQIIKAGTETVLVRHPDQGAVRVVPQPLAQNQIVLLTSRTTNQGRPPQGSGPLFSASWRIAGTSFEIVVQRIQETSFDVEVAVDWAIIDP